MKEPSFLIRLSLQMGEYEKTAYALVKAENSDEACKIALLGECHMEPALSDVEPPQCWDGGEFLYTVKNVKQLTDEQAKVYIELTSF